MEHLQDLTLFVRIAQAQSLSGVARDTGLSLATVSKQLTRLEQELGVQLVKRSTRHLYLTAEGLEYARHCTLILDQLEQARDAIRPRDSTFTGELRITASLPFSRRHLAPMLVEFGQRHPQLRLMLTSTDALVSMVQGGFDLAIRQAELVDSSLAARLLAPDQRIACASPAYVEQHGMLSDPSELTRHRCILPGDPPIGYWRFISRLSGVEQAVHVGNGAFQTNDGEVAHSATLSGAGIALKSAWDVAEDLSQGRLINVLPDFLSPAGSVYAVYLPGPRPLAGKLRALIDFLAERLAHSPVLDWIHASAMAPAGAPPDATNSALAIKPTSHTLRSDDVSGQLA